jgi:hypothetical protein
MKASDKMKQAYANMKEGKMTGKKMAMTKPQPTFEKWLDAQNMTLDSDGSYTRQDNKKFTNAQLRYIYEKNKTNDRYLKTNENQPDTETNIRAIDGIANVQDIGGSTIIGKYGADMGSDGNWVLNKTSITGDEEAIDKPKKVVKGESIPVLGNSMGSGNVPENVTKSLNKANAKTMNTKGTQQYLKQMQNKKKK